MAGETASGLPAVAPISYLTHPVDTVSATHRERHCLTMKGIRQLSYTAPCGSVVRKDLGMQAVVETISIEAAA